MNMADTSQHPPEPLTQLPEWIFMCDGTTPSMKVAFDAIQNGMHVVRATAHLLGLTIRLLVYRHEDTHTPYNPQGGQGTVLSLHCIPFKNTMRL